MEAVKDTSRSAACQHALLRAPGLPVILICPALVTVRSLSAQAIAYTVTHVLVEWVVAGESYARWEASWLVRKTPSSS